jgi:hypothetical protein
MTDILRNALLSDDVMWTHTGLYLTALIPSRDKREANADITHF